MIPTFSRIEMRLPDKGSLATAADELEALAQRLRKLSQGKAVSADETRLIAHNAIRETSQKLRGTGK